MYARVADVPETDENDKDISGNKEAKEKLSYITRDVAARRCICFGRKLVRFATGVEMCAVNVIVIDDSDITVQVNLPTVDAPPLTIEVEP